MTAGQAIDTSSYTDAAPIKSSASSTKSYTDNSSKFEDIFNSVNKAYDSSTSVVNSNASSTKTANAANANNTNNTKTSDNKVEDNKNTQKTDSQNVHKQDEQTKTSQEVKTNNQEQTHTAQNSDTKKTRDNDNKDNKGNKDSKDDSPKDDNVKKTDSSSEQVKSQDTQAQAVDNSISSALKDIDASAQVPTDTKTQTQTASDQQPSQQAQQVADNADVTKVAPNLNDIVDNQTKQVNVQTQTQQVLSDVKIDPEENKKQTAKDASEQTNVKTPVIAATTEAIAASANVKTADTDKSQNLNDVMAKASLTQDVIDKTNAKVVSVETSTSNSNNLLNKENAEEQTIKLALEANSNRTANLADSTTQSGFAKTLDGIQNEAPKEMSKTDVMSQIHSQLDKLQDETTTKVTIVLKPENLGKINLELTSGKDGITARMTTDSAQVKELLDKNIDGLKNSLGNQGVNVNNVTIKVAEAPKASSSDMFSFNDQAGKENPQQQPNNTGSGNENQSSFHQEAAVSAGELSEADTETENPASAGSHTGQVDYQV